ncbi:hypothetical protein [Phytohabitans rumicis]|uniref:Uncharacterized protein n=1 Tax=Phytohabitans rumicis TaxID=1076125 RepID=A0A6V8LEV3_9ACTN|nr:hypothetical protein [Phytohabitans rumicis]GFJ93139.1 hypothetical protein Prum_067810 [Phytohabitans rumicis]
MLLVRRLAACAVAAASARLTPNACPYHERLDLVGALERFEADRMPTDSRGRSAARG